MDIVIREKNNGRYKILLQVEEAVKNYLKQQQYLEIKVPLLSPVLIPESYLEIFKTQYVFLDKTSDLFLTPSPELFLKRLLAKGIGNCFSFGESFRNSEPASSLHSSEFTMLEFYKVGAKYLDIADEVLTLLQYIAKVLNGTHKVVHQGKTISFDQWERITVVEAFSKYASIAENELFNPRKFIKRAEEKNYNVLGFTYEDIFSQIYAQEVEPHLGVNGFPTLIYDYPKEFAALAKLNPDSKTAQRFEFYIAGVELGDCYTELTNWKEQSARFKKEEKKRKDSQKIIHPIDKEYIKILQYGLPSCAGIAIGFDRLAMIFANATSIHDLRLINIID